MAPAAAFIFSAAITFSSSQFEAQVEAQMNSLVRRATSVIPSELSGIFKTGVSTPPVRRGEAPRTQVFFEDFLLRQAVITKAQVFSAHNEYVGNIVGSQTSKRDGLPFAIIAVSVDGPPFAELLVVPAAVLFLRERTLGDRIILPLGYDLRRNASKFVQDDSEYVFYWGDR
jgi:hypothetical protein